MSRTIHYRGFEIFVHSETMPAGTYNLNESTRETAYQAQVYAPDGRMVYATDFLSSADELRRLKNIASWAICAWGVGSSAWLRTRQPSPL